MINMRVYMRGKVDDRRVCSNICPVHFDILFSFGQNGSLHEQSANSRKRIDFQYDSREYSNT